MTHCPRLIIAHRGDMAEAPENTRPAFDLALARGVDGIEFDVQPSRDGYPVIYHDARLSRITGSRKFLSEYPFQELAGLDWGRWFSERFRHEKILLLDEVLRVYGPKTRLFIEIKPPPKPSLRGLYQDLARRTVDLMETELSKSRILEMFVLSFDPDLIRTAHGRWPDLRFVLNLETASMDAKSLGLNPELLSGVCINRRKLHQRFVAEAHGLGKLVMTYSCNSERTLTPVLALGVDGVMTDAPGAPLWRKRGLLPRNLHEKTDP